MKHLIDVIPNENGEIKNVLQVLENSLTAFSQITGVPVTFFSPDEVALWEYNGDRKICTANREYYDEKSSCRLNLKSAMKTSYRLDDTYMFVCNSGLINMCCPYIHNNELLGYFNAGPVATGKNRERAIMQFYDRVPQDKIDLPQLMVITDEFKVYTPKDVHYLSTMFTNALNAPLISAQEKSITQQQHLEQAEIGMKIIEMKKSKIQIEYPLFYEQELINHIISGNCAASQKAFSKYIEELMVFEGGNISIIKVRLMTVFSKFFEEHSNLQVDYRYIVQLETINSASTFAEIINDSNRIIEIITASISDRIYSGTSQIIREALEYILSHFKEDINLHKVADETHVNNTYLSTLFKKEMGVSIVDYINDLRLEEARKLIRESELSITEVALSCGFKEASYFSKLFKKKYGETPRRYKEQLHQ